MISSTGQALRSNLRYAERNRCQQVRLCWSRAETERRHKQAIRNQLTLLNSLLLRLAQRDANTAVCGSRRGGRRGALNVLTN